MYNIITEVVSTNIPLLMSLKSLERLGAKIDCKLKTIEVEGKIIHTIQTKTGHMALNIMKGNSK